MGDVDEGLVLPRDPLLAELALALNRAGQWAEIMDDEWRRVFVTESFLVAGGFLIETAPSLAGHFAFGTEYVDTVSGLPTGSIAVENTGRHLACLGGWVIEDLPGGRDELRTLVDARLTDVVERISSTDESTSLTYVYDG